MKPRELKVFDVVIWKHTADSMGASIKTNNPLLFYDWALDTLNGFDIEHFEHHLTKMAKMHRVMTENPDAITFSLRVRFQEQADAAIFKMRWC